MTNSAELPALTGLPNRRIVLASGSPRRRSLLAAIPGVPDFEVDVADIDETRRTDEAPLDYALRLSKEKALAVAARQSSALVIGADTIVVLDDTILEKPRDEAEARSFLGRLRGRRHVVITAVTVVDGAELGTGDAAASVLRPGAGSQSGSADPSDGGASSRSGSAVRSGAEHTGVWLRRFGDDEMAAYIATGDPLDKAGGYAIQHGDFEPVARIEGSESNVVGLPISLTLSLLRLPGLP